MKGIPNFKGFYATEDGEIYSDRCGYLRKLPKSIHKGYYRVNVRDNSQPRKHYRMNVHTLVLNAFVGERPQGMVCRHLNGNPLDNRLCNLKWGTPQENTQDSIRHGTAVCLRSGEFSVASKLKLTDIYEIRKMYKEGYKRSDIAQKYSLSWKHVDDIVRGKTWKKDAPL